jgi:hypothetical protein
MARCLAMRTKQVEHEATQQARENEVA